MMPGLASDLLGSVADAAQTRTVFDDIGFVAVQNPKTISIGAALECDSRDLARKAQRAERNDAKLRYSAGIAALGSKAHAFLTGPALSDCLLALTGARFILTEDMSCLTVYEAGDQLGAHLDQPPERCAITCILYLACTSPDPLAANTGLQLQVYGPDRESTLRPARSIIRTRPGRLVLGRGAQIWHARPQLQPGERVTALTACFGAA